MGIKVGMVGLTNVGKTTIYNAITASEVECSNYTFATIDPNTSIVNIPDKRVDEIYENIPKSNRKVYNTIKVVDIAGLIKGASQGEGLGNKFLGDIKEVDAILHVVRCFDDDNIIHVENSVDPMRDIETIESELMIKDLETLEARIEKNKKLVRSNDKDAKLLEPLYQKLKDSLTELIDPASLNLTSDEINRLKDLNLITLKPVIFVCNISESELISQKKSDYTRSVEEYAQTRNARVVKICGQIEEEISQLEEEDKSEYMHDFHLLEPGLNRLLSAAYSVLGMSAFITAGEIEVRAWNIPVNCPAPQAAGVIHTDFEKKFIKAEVISFDDFKKCEFSRSKAKTEGLVRLEGKSYLVQDGDVIIFKVGK